jgi:predicted lipid-binding transport protein (Tim44 family)
MFGKFCLRVLVGTLVICLFGGAGMLAMAVICTAGVGLIVVIPAAYLIGLVCTIWFIPFGSKREEQEGQNRKPPEQHHAQPARVGWKCSPQGRSALLDYIAAAEAKGQEWQTIRADLMGAGWAAEIVDNARENSDNRWKDSGS